MPAIRPIRTKRLLIRDWEAADVSAIQRYAGDRQVCRYMVWGPNTIGMTRAFMRLKLRRMRIRPRRSFELGIARRDTGEIIGSVGLRLKSAVNRDADVGYVLARAHWGKGYMTEAVRAILRWGFRAHGLHRIWATCDRRNRRSAAVLERVGMRREALFRQDDFVKGRWRDSYLYAILKSEFKH